MPRKLTAEERLQLLKERARLRKEREKQLVAEEASGDFEEEFGFSPEDPETAAVKITLGRGE